MATVLTERRSQALCQDGESPVPQALPDVPDDDDGRVFGGWFEVVDADEPPFGVVFFWGSADAVAWALDAFAATGRAYRVRRVGEP